MEYAKLIKDRQMAGGHNKNKKEKKQKSKK